MVVFVDMDSLHTNTKYLAEMQRMEKYLSAIGLEEGEIIDWRPAWSGGEISWMALWDSFPLAMRYLGIMDKLRFPISSFLRDGCDIYLKPDRVFHKVKVNVTRSGHGLVVQDMKHDRWNRILQQAPWREQRNVKCSIAIEMSGV